MLSVRHSAVFQPAIVLICRLECISFQEEQRVCTGLQGQIILHGVRPNIGDAEAMACPNGGQMKFIRGDNFGRVVAMEA